MKHCSMGSSDGCKDLLASLDLLTVPLLEDSIPGIVSSFELGEIKTMTSELIKHLDDLDGRYLVNALLFLSAITSARADAADFLTTELIDKTYRHMRRAESERHPGITGAAMTLLANIAVYHCEEVMELLEMDEEHPQNSVLKTLSLICSHTNRDWKERRSAAQTIQSMDDLITHTQYQAGPPESFDFWNHLLHPSYGLINHQDDGDVLQDTDTMQAAMCYYITCVLTDEERKKVVHYLLIAIRSAVRKSKIISVMFFSELLRHPELLEKTMTKALILLMVSKVDSSDELEVCLAIEAIGNACEGAPRQVHQLKDVIFGCLYRKLSSFRMLKVVIKSFQALSKFVNLLKRSKLGGSFGKIVSLCTDNLNHPNLQIQANSISLFADLAKNCNRNKRDFSKHIRSCLSDFLIKLHSKDQQVKAAGITALLHCLPYIGCNNVEELLSADGEKYCKIYEQLRQKEPALLEKMMLHSMELLYLRDEIDAILKHLTMIRDALPYEKLCPTALCAVFKRLRRLSTLFYIPEAQEASYRAMDILGTKWKSILTAKVVKVGKPATNFFERETIRIYETSL
ncbi:maestro heat-like repeat-containing protein family member 2A [Anomaloglossus baeobatrachus]|uniref:maestro heat-like repeat-containing protein family member 2A n=1 Tax=Anomaloglossus baeobatrachus TaxID=238106 RepID=UPI003F4F7B96